MGNRAGNYEGGSGVGNHSSSMLSGLPTLDGAIVDLNVSGGQGEGAGFAGLGNGPLDTSSPYPVFRGAGASSTTGNGGDTASRSEAAAASNGAEGTQSGPDAPGAAG